MWHVIRVNPKGSETETNNVGQFRVWHVITINPKVMRNGQLVLGDFIIFEKN